MLLLRGRKTASTRRLFLNCPPFLSGLALTDSSVLSMPVSLDPGTEAPSGALPPVFPQFLPALLPAPCGQPTLRVSVLVCS